MTILFVLAIIYAIACIIIYLFQRDFLYQPQPAGTVNNVETFNLEQGDFTLSGWIINPSAKNAIIYYGGNAEAIDNNIELFRTYFSQYAVYLVPYRGYGGNKGKPNEKDLYSDAQSVYLEVKKKHEKVSLIGRSLGSGVATQIAATNNIDKLILLTPYDSIEKLAADRFRIFPEK